MKNKLFLLTKEEQAVEVATKNILGAFPQILLYHQQTDNPEMIKRTPAEQAAFTEKVRQSITAFTFQALTFNAFLALQGTELTNKYESFFKKVSVKYKEIIHKEFSEHLKKAERDEV